MFAKSAIAWLSFMESVTAHCHFANYLAELFARYLA